MWRSTLYRELWRERGWQQKVSRLKQRPQLRATLIVMHCSTKGPPWPSILEQFDQNLLFLDFLLPGLEVTLGHFSILRHFIRIGYKTNFRYKF